MRSRIFLLSALLILGAELLQPDALEKKDSTGRPTPAAQRLIRLDLLHKTSRPDVRTWRNIFILGSSGGETVLEAGRREAGPESGPEVSPGPDQAQAAPEIRYIGYVATAKKVVGLVFTAGQATAVAEGDTVAGIYTVLKIGPEVLELTGPDGQTRTVSIEGERR